MILNNWDIKSDPPTDFYKLVEDLGLSRLQAKCFYARGLRTKSELLDYIHPKEHPDIFCMKGMRLAVNRIKKAFEDDEQIAIYSDYDVDGITSAALLYLFFKTLCYARRCDRNILVFFSDRIKEGYGLKEESIDELYENEVSLVITLDNGTSAYDAIEKANELGIDVVIVDHHRVPDKVPNAHAMINPKQDDCPYPFKDLCTAGLVYKLTHALGTMMLSEDLKERFLSRYLDLAAIGTYQDMVPLKSENRFLVKQGITVLQELHDGKKTSMRGLVELLKLNASIDTISSETLGFYIGPRLNSAGRIGKPHRAFQLLVNSNMNEVRHIAAELDQLNQQRQLMTLKGYKEACDKLSHSDISELDVLFVHSEEWHPGIIGLIAQRLTQHFKKSSIVLTKSLDHMYVASARGFGNINMVDFIRQFEDILLHYGGHAKAAGFSIEAHQLDTFKQVFSAKVDAYTTQVPQNEAKEMEIDLSISINELYNPQFYADLNLFEPHGIENEAFIFGLTNLTIHAMKPSKRQCDTLFTFFSNHKYLNAIAFNDISYLDYFSINDNVCIAFHLSGNETKPEIRIVGMHKKQ